MDGGEITSLSGQAHNFETMSDQQVLASPFYLAPKNT